jgi:hypothetical protein
MVQRTATAKAKVCLVAAAGISTTNHALKAAQAMAEAAAGVEARTGNINLT